MPAGAQGSDDPGLVVPPEGELVDVADGLVVGGGFVADRFTILLDPDYALTTAYGLRWDAKNETAYPSTFVIDGKRKVTFTKVSTSHSDGAKVEDVLAKLSGK